MTGPWSHEWDGAPVSAAAMAAVLEVDVGDIKARAEQWADLRAAGAADVGRAPGPDDRAYAGECGCTLAPAAARAVWGQFF